MISRKQSQILAEKRRVINSVLPAILEGKEFSLRAETKKVKLTRPTVTSVVEKVREAPEQFEEVNSIPDSKLLALLKRPAVADKPKPDYASLLSFIHKHSLLKKEAYLVYCEQCKEKSVKPVCQSGFYDGFAQFEDKKTSSMMFRYKAGEVVFVDFAGKRPSITDPSTGEKTKVELFIATLGHSNWVFAYACATQCVDDWVTCHEKLFEEMGGVPEYVTPDNLKSAVSKPGKSFVLNRLYQDMALHYATHIEPARSYKPKDKARAEAAVRHAYQFLLRKLVAQTFFSIEELNAALRPLVVEFNAKPFQRLQGSRKQWFEESEKPALSPLPKLPLIKLSALSYCKVNSNYHILVKNHWYSVSYELIGERVSYRTSQTHVYFYYESCPIAEHKLSTEIGGMTTEESHRDPKHAAYANLSKPKLLKWASQVGPNTIALINAQFENKPDGAPSIKKRCGDFKSLAEKHGYEAFEKASENALNHSSPSLRFVTLMLNQSQTNNRLH